jgi:hypothetical protein
MLSSPVRAEPVEVRAGAKFALREAQDERQ